jgi:rhodanese-related sulfurtransferase
LNYALGLTRINTSHYIITSYIAMLPGAIAYTYLGYVGREAVAGGEGLIQKGLLGLALLATVAFLPRLIGKLRKGGMLNIEELKQRIDSGAQMLVLDVRSEDDFTGEQGHIFQANNIPLETLPNRLGEISDYQQHPVVIVCRTDKRSAKAAQLLAQNGFADVHVAHGGMVEWNQSGFPVER